MNYDGLWAAVGTLGAAALGLWQVRRADRTERAKLAAQTEHMRADDEAAFRTNVDASVQRYLQRLENRIATLEERLLIAQQGWDAERTTRRHVEEELDRARGKTEHLEQQVRDLEIRTRADAERIRRLESQLSQYRTQGGQ